MDKIALGGGCHWCTEAVYQSLVGVRLVEQGYVASNAQDSAFSEAVIIHFEPYLISLKKLIEIHLYTHKCTSSHGMRSKYRSAIYSYSEKQFEKSQQILDMLQSEFHDLLITKVYFFESFKPSKTQFLNYYYSNSEKPFCENYIEPKLQLLLQRFVKQVDGEKLFVKNHPTLD